MMGSPASYSYLAPPLIATIASIILMIVVWRGAQRHRLIFSGLLLSLALWSFVTFGMRSSPDVQHALLWDRMILVPGYAIFVFFYHFTVVYTNTVGQRSILVGSYVSLAVVAALAPTDLVIVGMRLEEYGYAPVLSPIASSLSTVGFFVVGAAIYNLVRRYRASSSYEERNHLLYLVIAPVFLLAGGLVDYLSDLPPVAIWSNLIFCTLCSVAILKYHLLDIQVVARKGLIYALVSSTVAIPYVGLLYSVNYFFQLRLDLWWVHSIIILLLAIMLRPLYSWAQQVVDRLFYRDRYDYLRALQQFSHEAQSITSLEELSSNMVQLVTAALRTSTACLLLMSGSNSGFVIVSYCGLDGPIPKTVLRNSSPLVKWLELNKDIISSEEFDIVPQLQNFSLKEKHTLELVGAKLCVPMVTRRGQLPGILILGEKLSQQSYSREDKQLLRAISNQMAMVLENARLYEETRQSEEKLRLMYESIAEGIIVTDLDGNIVQVNKAVVHMYGSDNKEEFIGRSAFDFVAKKDHARAIKNLKRTLRDGYVTNVEYTLLRRDGSEFPAELNAAVLKDVPGNPTGFVIVTEDITERKQAQERESQLQQELNLSSRLAAVGELAAGVAHQINNPLTGILGYSQRLSRKSTDEKVKQDLESIHNEALRAARVVENLLTFARRHKVHKQPQDINDIVQKALDLRAYELRTGNIEVALDLAPGLRKVTVDFYQIQEVFLNIILNAEQAMIETNGGGKLGIKTEEAKDYIRALFSDNGPGIPAEHLDKLFDPFFTTKGAKGGTGLGLSVCHGIVTEHGGKIRARSKPGKGATFFVELPILSDTAT